MRGDEGGVELWLDGQLCGEPTVSVICGPTANKLLNTVRGGRVSSEWPTCSAEIEESGQVAAAGQPRVGLAQLVKEGVRAGL